MVGDVELMKRCLETPGVDANALVPAKPTIGRAHEFCRSPLMACVRAMAKASVKEIATEPVRMLLEAKALYTTQDSDGVSVTEFMV